MVGISANRETITQNDKTTNKDVFLRTCRAILVEREKDCICSVSLVKKITKRAVSASQIYADGVLSCNEVSRNAH